MASDRDLPSTFLTFAGPKSLTVDVLREYLLRLAEWDRQEFKACISDVGPAFRRAVCSLANTNGGEVFVGVDNDRNVIGTALDSERLRQSLGEPTDQTADWYSTDPSSLVRQITRVPLADEDGARSALVVEVRRTTRPILTDVGGRLELLVRRGDSSVRASGKETLEWYRTRTRERMLQLIYIEFAGVLGRLQSQSPDLVLGDSDFYPFTRSRLQDGRLYELLSPEDLALVVGRGIPSGGMQLGCISPIIELKGAIHQLQFETAGRQVGAVWYRTPRALEVLAKAGGDLESRVSALKSHLEAQGIPVPAT